MSNLERKNPLLLMRRNALLFTSRGADGKDGRSAYEYAVAGGYVGTEAEFAAKLAQELPTALSDLTEDSGHSTVTQKAKGNLEQSDFITLEGEDEDGNTYEYELLGYTDAPI